MAKRSKEQAAGLARRRSERARREEQMQRGVVIAAIVVAALVVGLVSFALLNEYVLEPRRPVISVNDQSIMVKDFQDRVKFGYYLQAQGQSPEALGVDSSIIGDFLIDDFINDMLIAEQAEALGISVTDEEVQETLELGLGYDSGDPEPTPTAFPTLDRSITPTVTPTFVYTQTPRPTATLEPGVTPTATVMPTATPDGPTPEPSITPTLAPSSTPEPVTEEMFEDNLSQIIEQMAFVTGMEPDKLRELWFDQVRRDMLRNRVFEATDIAVTESKEVAHAAHILVATEEEALDLLSRLSEGEAFNSLAAQLSLDTSNAYRGGDLGWFGKGIMVSEFEDAAFTMAAGAVSDPIETQFGWHIIKVYDRATEETTAAERESERSNLFAEMLAGWKEEANIVIDENWLNYMPSLP